jgi:dTMP kinase
MTRGRLIAFEGGEGSGKSTQAALLARAIDAVLTREPGGTPLGEQLRSLVLDADNHVDARAEALLMAAARAQHVHEVIEPALAAGRDVVTDRFTPSSIAYQGYGRGLDAREVLELNSWAVETVVPDRTFYLRLSTKERALRAAESEAPLDRIERVGGEFMGRVEAGFEEIARAEPERVRVLDASLPPEELVAAVRAEIMELRAR